MPSAAHANPRLTKRASIGRSARDNAIEATAD
jgi:hypothetical protein